MSLNTEGNVVLLERSGPIATLTLNRPAQRNAYSLTMREALLAYLHELMKPGDDCRAIVLCGAGGSFCAGGDISEMKRYTSLEVRARFGLVTDIFKLMVCGPKPVVSAVEGAAMGAGLSLVAASDYVVTAANARYGCSFAKMGVLPDSGLLWSLSQKVGAGTARDLMLQAGEFDGQRALALGFANEIAAPGMVRAAATEVAARLARMPPIAIALLKAALAGGCDTLEQAYETEINLQPLLRCSQDHREAVKAFLEKREPVFTGH